MTSPRYRFDNPDNVLIGTIGVPGEREFYLQVQDNSRIYSFALEKSQADALSRRSLQMLQNLGLKKSLQMKRFVLATPLESEFQIGVISISWQPVEQKFQIDIQQVRDNVDTEGAAIDLQIIMTPETLNYFAEHTLEIVAAGRQPCLFCGGPINAEGHLCPRSNRYRRME